MDEPFTINSDNIFEVFNNMRSKMAGRIILRYCHLCEVHMTASRFKKHLEECEDNFMEDKTIKMLNNSKS